MTWEVGQRVFLSRSDRRWGADRWATITKVARKWVYLGEERERFDKETGVIDGGDFSSPGRAWRSEDDYKEHLHAEKLLTHLRREIGFTRRKSVGKKEILEALRLLGIDPPKDDK